MSNNQFFQVLWIENDPLIVKAYPLEAERENLQLHSFTSWEEAKDEFEANYTKWDAIILDAKCKYKKDDADKASNFLTNVLYEIEEIAKLKKHTIPWYVLSGEGEDDIRDLIPKNARDWDADWDKTSNRPFYSKGGKTLWGGKEEDDRRILFMRIKNYVTRYKSDLKIERDLYPEVFRAIDKMNLADTVGSHLIKLLKPIHSQKTSDENNYQYVDLRKAIEYMFRHMVEKRILPRIILDKNDHVNLSWSSLFLGGDDQNGDLLWKKVKRNTPSCILPKQLAAWLKTATFQTGGAVHTSEAESEIRMNLDKYLPLIDGSSYMLQSLTLGFCDFVLWYNNYLKEHLDEEKNAKIHWSFLVKKSR